MSAETTKLLPDADARRRAATDFDTNLVVLAGAGTGKTSLLVERALNAIGSGVATMESIAAITFTEKAAGELRERLALGLDRLRSLAADGGELDDVREADRAFRHLGDERGIARDEIERRALAAMEQVDHGTVVTIHGFCSELLRGHPLEAEVDPGFSVDSGGWLDALSADGWQTFVTRELGPEAQRRELWEGLLTRLPLGRLEPAARKLAGFGVADELLDPAAAEAGVDLLIAEADAVYRRMEHWLARPDGLTDLGRRLFSGLATALDAARGAGPAAGRELLIQDADLLVRLAPGGKGFPGPPSALDATGKREHGDILRDARYFCRGLLQVDDAVIADVLRSVRPFAREFREDYLRRGLVDFDGLLVLTRNLLRDHPAVREVLKRRFRLLLVDEFQDTDPLQYEIVLYLAEQAGDEAGDAYASRLEPGRLFVVGDAKQSIYRFRGADYAAYSRAVDRIEAEGGVRLDLVGNFRSVPGIVEPINELFTATDGCWHASGYQPDYVPIRAVRPDAAEPAVEIWTVDLPPKSRAEERREAEGRAIAETIENWVERDGTHDYRQITILFRAFSNITHYLRPLRERGIPFVVDGGREFLRRPEVVQLMAALRALSRPADQPALLAYLRSPAGGVSDTELASYAEAKRRWSWRLEADAAMFPNIARAFDALRELWQEIGTLPVDALVRRVLDRTLLQPLGAAAFEGPQRVANLQKLTAAAGELARDGTLTLDEVLDALEQGRLEDIETDRPLADDAAEAVRITSIHRMKGLENDVVIVPDLARQRARGQFEPKPLHIGASPEGGALLALDVNHIVNSARIWYDLEDKRHENAEEVRVFYVALTRARERLVLVSGPSKGSRPWLEALAPWGYDPDHAPADGERLADGRIVHRKLTPPKRGKLPEQEIPAAAADAVRAYREAARELHAAARPPLEAPSALGEERPERGPVSPERRGSRAIGKAVGNVLHRLLERWDPATSPDEALEVLCRDVARETRTDREALQSEARQLVDTLRSGALPDRLGELERLGAEVPVLVRDDDAGRTFLGSIDLLYRDPGGQIVVADYKTDREADAAKLQAAYGAQLATYADAVRQAMKLPRRPRMELWLLRTGEILTLDGPPPEIDRGDGDSGTGDDPAQLSLF